MQILSEKEQQEIKELKLQKLHLLENIAQYKEDNRIEYFNTQAFPANPKQAELLEAYEDRLYKVFTYTGGNRCLGAEVPIYDPITKKSTLISEIDSDFHVLSWDGSKLVVAPAEKPFRKDLAEPLYRVRLNTSQEFVASGGHEVLSPSGYVSVSRLRPGFALIRPQSTLDTFLSIRDEDAQNFLKTEQDSRYDCPACSPQVCDGQPLLDQEVSGGHIPLHTDVQESSYSFLRSGALASRELYSRLYQLIFHPSIPGVQGQSVGQFFVSLFRNAYRILSFLILEGPLFWQPSIVGVSEPPQVPLTNQHQSLVYDSFDSSLPGSIVTPSEVVVDSIEKIRDDVKWDFHVPVYNNYWAAGVIHHNSGKTFIATYLAVCTIIGKWPYDGGKRLPFSHRFARKVRIIGQGWEDHVKKVVVPELKFWWPKNRPVTIKKNNTGVEALWTDIKTGGTIELMSNMQDPAHHEGWKGDLVYYDEAPTRDIRVANSRGLVDRLGREIFAMTLLSAPWVDREVIKMVDEKGKPDRSVFNVHTEIYDNLDFGITKEGIDQYAKALTEEEREIRLLGVPAYKRGLIYPTWNRQKHLTDRFKIPLDWIVDIAIDVHPRERQAVLFIATNPRNERYIIDEIWEHGDGTYIAEEIVRRVKRNAYRVSSIIIDPLSKGDSNLEESTYVKVARTLMRHDLVLMVGSKDKTSGFLEVKNHLVGPNKKPSLFVFDDVVRFIYEIEGYMYVDKGEHKGKPQDVDDHQCENLYRLLLLNTQYIPPEDERTDIRQDDDTGMSKTTAY